MLSEIVIIIHSPKHTQREHTFSTVLIPFLFNKFDLSSIWVIGI